MTPETIPSNQPACEHCGLTKTDVDTEAARLNITDPMCCEVAILEGIDRLRALLLPDDSHCICGEPRPCPHFDEAADEADHELTARREEGSL